jgi:hypothetical protein
VLAPRTVLIYLASYGRLAAIGTRLATPTSPSLTHESTRLEALSPSTKNAVQGQSTLTDACLSRHG